MLITEFEALTGFHPTADLYKEIEDVYYGFDGDKVAFCKAYAENRDGMADKIARNVDMKRVTKHSEEVAAAEELRKEIQRLQEALEKEQEWEPNEDYHNVSQKDYEHLAGDSTTKVLSDEEAADLIAEEFGFDRSKITIVHEVWKVEKNRHGQLRRNGKYERKALFNVWDWNYIRFNVRGNVTMSYEMYDGDLRMYWC